MNILKSIISFILGWLKGGQNPLPTPIDHVEPTPIPSPPQNPPVAPIIPQNDPTPFPPRYDWSTPLAARISFRMLCDDAHLSISEKNLLCSVLQCESGFNVNAINHNKDGTTDYGICQYNSYWYIEKMKLITQEQAMHDPEFACKLFIQRYKQGFLKDWVCYSSGNYKNY